MYRVSARPNRLLIGFYPTFHRRCNVTLLIPFRLFMMTLHFTALICAAHSSDAMIRVSLSASYRADEKYIPLRRSADACLALSFLCLFFLCWGVVTARTLRSGLMNTLHGGCHAAAAILLIMSWHLSTYVLDLWYVFCIFNIIPAVLEIIALCESYTRGTDNFF